jgi:plastocyanin
MIRPLSRIAVLPVLAALVLAGCGSSNNDNSSSASNPTPKSTAAKGGGAAPAVTMQNIQFVPATITAKVGQKITWTNNDSVAHTVVKAQGFSGAGPGSGTVNPGSTYSFTPTKAGTIPYFCQIHPNQKGTIVVTK